MNNVIKISLVFAVWRIALFVIAFSSQFIIIKFGGTFPYYQDLIETGLPQWGWGFANFDGVHYINIVKMGYSLDYSQAFFPLYPLLIKLFDFFDPLITGLLLSNLFFLLALIAVYYLFKLDYKENISFKSIIFLLSFPTAFFFGALYTESLFLLLVVLSIYCIRKQYYMLAGLLGALASATRIIGVLLIPVLLIEVYLLSKKHQLNRRSFIPIVISLCLMPLGLLFYMGYLNMQFNDPIYFLTVQPHFGASRSSEPFTLLPQVLYRYMKIFATVDIKSLVYLNALLEFVFTVVPLGIMMFFYKKIRLSYLFFMVSSLIIPTLTGTLSSMPRYALMSFLLIPVLVSYLENRIYILMTIFIILQVIFLTMFIRGYWIA